MALGFQVCETGFKLSGTAPLAKNQRRKRCESKQQTEQQTQGDDDGQRCPRAPKQQRDVDDLGVLNCQDYGQKQHQCINDQAHGNVTECRMTAEVWPHVSLRRGQVSHGQPSLH